MAELDESIRQVITKHQHWMLGSRRSEWDAPFEESLAEAIEQLVEHRLRSLDAISGE